MLECYVPFKLRPWILSYRLNYHNDKVKINTIEIIKTTSDLVNEDMFFSKADNDRRSGPFGPDFWYQVKRQGDADGEGHEPKYPGNEITRTI